jgi:glycosyltransferase involved in cell wall biosynthesis
MRVTLLSHFPGRGGSTSLLKQLHSDLETRQVTSSIIVGRDASDSILKNYRVVEGTSPLDRRRSYLQLLSETAPDVVFRISGVEELDWLRFTALPRASHFFSFESHDYLSIPHLARATGPFLELCSANTPDLEDLLNRTLNRPVPFQLLPYHISREFLTVPEPTLGLDEPLRIAYVGRLDSFQKQIERLPRIIQLVASHRPDLRWEIHGDGPEKARLLTELDARHVAHMVTFHAWTAPRDLPAALKRCQLFFLCSKWEGLPTALVESMLCGLAPVVPKLPAGIAHTVTPKMGWTYEPNKIETAAATLCEAVADRSRLLACRREAWRTAQAMAAPEAIKAQTDAFVHRLRQLKFNGNVETQLDMPALSPLSFQELPGALARRSLRKLRNLLSTT